MNPGKEFTSDIQIKKEDKEDFKLIPIPEFVKGKVSFDFDHIS